MSRRPRLWKVLLADVLLFGLVLQTPALAQTPEAAEPAATAPTSAAVNWPPVLQPPAGVQVQPLVASCLTTHSCIVSGATPPDAAPAPGEPFGLLYQGMFGYTKTDLTVAAPIPIVIARVYRDGDLSANGTVWNARDFGIGTSLNYDLYLYSSAEVKNQANPYSNINVVLPDGGQITCACSNGQCGAYQTAVLTCAAQPIGEWFDSTLSYNSSTPGWDLTRKDGTVYSFGQGAPLQSIHDRYNNSITINRIGGQNGLISSISASNGRYVNFAYSGNSIMGVVDNTGRTVSYNYTSGHNTLAMVTYNSYNSQSITKYYYGAAIGNITEITLNATDTNGSPHWNYNYITRNSNGNMVTFGPDIGSNGYTYSYGVSQPYEVSVTLPDSYLRNFYFDSNGYLAEDQRAPNTFNEITNYTRDGQERITGINDNGPPSQTTSYVYNSNGDVTSVTHTPGPGTVSSITTSFAYQGLGSGLFDELTSVTDPLLNVTNYYYDGSGNLTSIKDPMNRTSTYTYNSLGQLKSETTPSPLLETTNYGYSPSTDDLTSVTDPLNNVTNYTTDNLGRVTQVTTPLGHTASYVYDALDHVIQTTDGNGNVTSSTYDLLGLALTVTDANGNTTTVTRPWTLNKETTCDALNINNCTVLNLDGAGKTTDFTDKRNIKTVYTYNGLQEVTQVNVNSTGSGLDQRTMGYTYDALDRLTKLVDTVTGGYSQTNTLQYTYDGVNNVLSEAMSGGINGNITLNYDADSRRISASASGSGTSGQSYSYAYDLDSELTGISSTGGAPLSATLGYDNDGRRQSLTAGSVTTTYGYDADSQLTSLSFNSGALGQLGYNYDSDGRVTSESGSLASLNLPQSEGPNTYSATNQLKTWNNNPNSPVATDAASNITTDPTNGATLVWDSRNQLSSITNGPAVSFHASYDAILRRDSQTTAYGGTTTYVHDNKAVAQSSTTSAPSNPVNNYLTVPGTGEVLAFASTVGGTTGTYVPLQDGQGSTIGLVNSGNVLQTTFTYDPFGNPTAGGSATSYPFLFKGMEYDATGYYYGGGIYYSPALGRPLQQVNPGGSGGGGGGFNATVPSAQGSGGGISAGTGAVEAEGAVAAGAAAGAATAAFGVGSSDMLIGSFLGLAPTGVGLVVAAVVAAIFAILDVFGIFGGGGHAPVLPPGYYRAVHYIASQFLGIFFAITPNMDNSIKYEAPLGGRIIWVADSASCPCGCSSCTTQQMLVTGYCNQFQCTGKNPGDKGYGITKNHSVAGHGTIAAPKGTPMGTRMYVPGYGCGTVEDRGGDIHNGHIDLWFTSPEIADQWGNPHLPVTTCH